MRVAVQSGRLAVGGPSGVCNAAVEVEFFGHIDTGARNHLPQFGYLAHLFKRKNFISLVAINSETG